MKKSFLFLVIICLSLASKAQESNDYGIYLGMGFEHAQTILPIPEVNSGLPSIYPAAGAFYRKNLNPRYSWRVEGNYGFNLAYYTTVMSGQLPLIASQPELEVALLPIDLHALFEINFLALNPRLEKPKVSTFVATGLGVYQLRPSIPFTVGVKYRVAEHLGLSVEWKLRRKIGGNILDELLNSPESNWFSFIGFSAHYNVIKTCKTCPFYETKRKKKR